MKLDRIGQSGTTQSRQSFWDNVRDAVLAQQKKAGRNVTVDEHYGAGSVINIADTGQRRGGGNVGACCVDGVCSITTEEDCTGHYLGDGTTCTDIDCTQGACCDDGDCSITTEEECTGTYQGDGTTCEDVDCGTATTGACCVADVCSITTPAGCEGSYQGDDTACDPNPCAGCTSGPCGFINPDDGLRYLTKNYSNDLTDDCPPTGICCCDPFDGHTECPPWDCNFVYYHGTYVSTDHKTSESYTLPDCSGGPGFCGDEGVTCEDLGLTTYCFCLCVGDTICPDCGITPFVCPTECTTNPQPPDFGHVCTSIDTTITYTDLSPCQ